MWIEVGNLKARLVRATEDERRWLSDYLSFEDEKARFRRAPGARIRMFNFVDGTFAAGFVGMVRKAATEEGLKVDLIDQRAPPCAPDPQADLGWLRDYQRDGVQKVVAETRGILWHPTGSGKTDTATGLGKLLPCRWLFLVHRGNLLDQAAERWEKRTGTPAGRVGDGTWVAERFTVATFQTLHARLKADPHDLEATALLAGAQGVVFDEAHILPANSFLGIAMRTPNAYWRVGMSGTPLARGDRRSLYTVAATGPVIHRVHPDVLIKAGVLSRPKIRMVPLEQHATGPGRWHDVYRELVVESRKRNDLVVRVTTGATKPSIVFVKEIDHGRALEAMIRKAGISCEFIWGTDSTEERRAAVRRLVRRDVDVLVASVVFNEGVDIPELRSVVIASGGKSVIAALQRVGRGMRVQKDAQGNVVKDEFEVWDVMDRGDRWLQRHGRARVRAYAGEGYETVAVEQSQLRLIV